VSATARRALCLSFDNLGEAAEVGAGTWPSDAPLGEHFTVGVVHRLLDLLDGRRVRATFFVEAFNAGVYPDLLREIAQRGHEVACHAWQHEHWSALDPRAERALLERCTRALRALGLAPAGFRPPGGLVTPDTARRLADQGYRYHSPVGSRAGVSDGVAVIPFAWPTVDAFYRAPALAGLRERFGLPADPPPAGELRARMGAVVRADAARGEPTTLVFHPMLLDDPAALVALDGVLADARAAGIECVAMRDLADRLLATDPPLAAPVLDGATWA